MKLDKDKETSLSPSPSNSSDYSRHQSPEHLISAASAVPSSPSNTSSSDNLSHTSRTQLTGQDQHGKKHVKLESVSTFEDLLKICGDGGPWQLKVFLLTSFCGFLTALHNLAYAFVGAIPPHWCQLPDIPGVPVETLKNYTIPLDKDDEYEECHRYRFIPGINHTADFSFLDRKSTESCQAIQFEDSIFKSTIVTEFDLVCGKEAWASTVQAMYMFGILVGSPLMGAISDRLGRKMAILISSCIFIVAGPIVALVGDFKWLMFARFVLGFSTPGIYGTSFVLMVEVIGPSWRGLAGNLFCLPFACGYMVLAGVAYFIRDWRTLQLVISIPSVLQIIVWWLLPESPRWLLRKGQPKQAEKIMRDMASWNKRKAFVPNNFRDMVEKVGGTEKEVTTKENFGTKLQAVLVGYANLLRTTQMRKRTLIIYFSWMSISMVYYGVALNSPNLSADRYIYTFISGLLEIPSYFMVPPLIRYIGRRPSFSGFLLLCGACLLSSLIFADGSVGIVILALTGKLLIGAAYALVYLYATEVMPTLLRSYGVGTASMVGRVGSVSAPYIVDLVGRGNKTYPTIIFGVVSVVAGTLSLLLPETRNRRLPETVDDVENRRNSNLDIQKI